MGYFKYNCPRCGAFKVSLDMRVPVMACPKCAEPSKPILKAGTVRLVERLDNGAMIRAVERPVDIEEMMEERDQISSERANRDCPEGD